MATEYVVSGTLLHNGESHEDGSLFSTDDKTLEQVLRRAGTLLTLEEYQRQAEANADVAAVAKALALREQMASASAAKDEELEALRKQLAEAQSANDALKSSEGSEDDSGSAEEPAAAESESEAVQPSEDSAEA